LQTQNLLYRLEGTSPPISANILVGTLIRPGRTTMTIDQTHASYLIQNAKIYCFDDEDSIADAILIESGRVAAVGRADDLRQLMGSRQLENRDLQGATILPGLIDTHPHLLHFAARHASLVDISDAVSHDQIVERIAARARTTPAGEWIMTTPVGEAYYFIRRSYRDLIEGELPTRQVLDRESSTHPVVIVAWEPNIPNTVAFNSMALSTLGITRELPDRVSGVTIEKDAQGEPTGRLHGAVNGNYSGDDFAYQLWRKVPRTDRGLVPGAIRNAIAEHHRLGITTVYENHLMNKRDIDVFRNLRNAGELQMRVMAAQEADIVGHAWAQPREDDAFMRVLERAAEAVEQTDDLFRVNGVSVAWDGGCYPGQLMMRNPYFGPTGEETRGWFMMDPRKIEKAMRFCAERRIRLHTLCSGTQAHEENLAMLERVAQSYDIRPLRWILVHTPFIEVEQIRRYKALNFDATTTMTFLFGTGDLFRRRFKPEFRDAMMRDLLPLRRFFDAGMTVAAGADWGPKNVFEQIQLALTHTTPSGFSNLGPSQTITRTQAVSMWTRDAARLLRWNDIGSLSPGSHADLIVLDRDPLACPIGEISQTRVLRTLFAGRTVYNAGVL
jgi:predicted amidohydrolase YtcJ